MPRESQATRINQLSAVVCQLALHLKTMVAIMVPDSEPIQAHVQQLADIADALADNRSPTFDFSITPEMEEAV